MLYGPPFALPNKMYIIPACLGPFKLNKRPSFLMALKHQEMTPAQQL